MWWHGIDTFLLSTWMLAQWALAFLSVAAFRWHDPNDAGSGAVVAMAVVRGIPSEKPFVFCFAVCTSMSLLMFRTFIFWSVACQRDAERQLSLPTRIDSIHFLCGLKFPETFWLIAFSTIFILICKAIIHSKVICSCRCRNVTRCCSPVKERYHRVDFDNFSFRQIDSDSMSLVSHSCIKYAGEYDSEQTNQFEINMSGGNSTAIDRVIKIDMRRMMGDRRKISTSMACLP